MSERSTQTESKLDRLQPEAAEHRKADYPVDPLFLNRWSPRSFERREVTDETLHTILEAARWSPSANNRQQWRFIVAKTEEQRALFHTFLNPGNLAWAQYAPVLIVLASARLDEKGEPNGPNAFDAGAAWSHLALQATLLGLHAHAMGGFQREEARRALAVPDAYDLHVVIALGYRGPREALPEALQEREKPNGRRPLAESIVPGRFPDAP
ncbi:nitroreductase family protein [Paenibacillus ginsengarvi]|uniref:Nitroreductase n=1 Tax=Paenibacillus ginsengarvi TaxID=400777 RepID=A0A3B0BRY0_9BACL|nr:nitroreductase family protein [Paenibacillus ginsengarvi]RKN76043.1 nitroreductase [Paenibacillus ginsengarvi]